jgi:hypothetical protein
MRNAMSDLDLVSEIILSLEINFVMKIFEVYSSLGNRRRVIDFEYFHKSQ